MIEPQSDDEPRARDRDARPWLAMIEEAERYFEDYQSKCDAVDRQYASLKRLCGDGEVDSEMQLFWANIETIAPAIYAREPVPVVTPRFKDRKPVPRKAAEILERALLANIEHDHLHETLEAVRDDMAITARGQVWPILTERDGAPVLGAEHVDRKDFLHGQARSWRQVPWVAKRAHLTRAKMKKRFEQSAPNDWFRVEFSEKGFDEDEEEHKGRKTAPVWEIWHKEENIVVWVSPGLDKVLDISEPYFDLEGFFPCPKPAYGTLQRRSLLPVPDYFQYRDQLEQINDLTARIAALTDSLKVRGFYPAGAGDVAEAVERALDDADDRQVMIAIPSMQSLAAGSGGKLVEWLPLDMVVMAIKHAIEERAQLIEDVYQITGISDIMRGDTEASETLGAQNLKAQFGSARIRRRQGEMIRFARDVVRIWAEIIAEQFDPQTLLRMSQTEDVPTMAAIAQAQAQGQQIDPDTVPIEAVMQLLQAERTRPFVLEVETDSTIQPNEDQEKARRIEFAQVVGAMAQQTLPSIQAEPALAPIVLEVLQFVAGGFRAGRTLEGEIDQFAQQMKKVAKAQEEQRMNAQQQPSPEQLQMQMEQQKFQAEQQIKMQEMQLRAQSEAAKIEFEREKAQADLQIKRVELEIKRAELQLKEADLELRRETAVLDGELRAADLRERVGENAIRRQANGAAGEAGATGGA